MGQYWNIEKEVGNIAVVVFDRKDKEVNTLAEGVLRELADVMTDLEADTALEGVVFISGKKDFIVGADIDEIARFKSAEDAAQGSRQMQALLQKISEFKVPTVAAIHGQALGGGLELALACTWRIGTDDDSTRLALPEIQLGLIPGAGGTQRLPRLVGIQVALDMILTGKKLTGKKALKAGLIDECVPKNDLREIAVRYAVRPRKKPRSPGFSPGKLAADLPKWATEGNPLGRKVMSKKAREMVDDKTKGFYPASYKALDAVFDGFETSLPKGLEIEAELFGQLAVTRESKSLIHLFHATTALKKHPYKDKGRERFGKEKVKTIGIIGSGFMGAGIATVAADRGIRSLLSDPNKDSVGRAMRHCREFFNKKLERRRIKPFELTQRMAHISPRLNTDGFSKCDVVIEAVFEDLTLKQKILANAEKTAGENFIFATNTSALPIGQIAASSKDASRVIGMHFFSPVEKMPLLEVVITDKTADWVTARIVDLGQDMGKQVIVVRDGPGFYTTRSLAFYLNEASKLLQEGARIEDIDSALTGFGFPVGPITLIDEVGIDVGMHVLETMEKAFPERMESPKGLSPVAESGRLGRKNNKGFYLYENGKKTRPDSSIYELLEIQGKSPPSREEIIDRCLLMFVNESVRCLEDGVLASPGDGDVGAVFGLGFPPFWGGPFRYVDHMGARDICSRLESLQEKFGVRFTPAKTLKTMAEKDARFFPEEA